MKREKSLLARLLLLVFIMILVPTLMMFIVFFRTVPNRMKSQAETNVNFYINQVANSITGSMELAQNVAFSAITDNALRTRMQNTETVLGISGQHDLSRVAGNLLTYQTAWNQRALGGVYLFRQDGDFTFYDPEGSYVQEQRWMQQIYESSGNLSSMRTLFLSDKKSDNMAYFLVDYKNLDNQTLLGKLIIQIDLASMANIDDLIQLYPGTCVFLNKSDGTCLYQQGNSITPEDIASDYYSISRQISEYDLNLEVYIPLRTLYSIAWESSGTFTALCVFILLVSILAIGITYHAIHRPLVKMEEPLARMAKSDYTARISHSGYRELAGFETAFNRMAENLESSFHDAYQKGVRLQESESRLLAAQINPHFLFNVLETINMRCVDAGLKDISHMVTSLAQLLRGNIGAGDIRQKVTFQQELKYVQYYLTLQQERFGRGLSWSIEYEDEALLQYLIPRLTVQPLVENAIVHGLEPRRGLGNVNIRLWEEDQTLCVRVEDNGVGFDATQLNFSSNLAEQDARHNHIALPNILRRLYLLYGDAASLEIRSTPGGGTTALLTIPLDETEV